MPHEPEEERRNNLSLRTFVSEKQIDVTQLTPLQQEAAQRDEQARLLVLQRAERFGGSFATEKVTGRKRKHRSPRTGKKSCNE